MRTVYGSPDAQAYDDHLRSLSTRGGAPDCYSVASDAPSVYSRVDYEPTGSQTFLSEYHHPHDSLERFQAKSNIDFGDDRSSHSSHSDDHNNDDDDSHSFEQDQEGMGDRMSYLGPKMRFHSLAPWEMDTDTLDEAEEPTESPKTTINIFPNPFGAHKASSVSSSPRPSHSTTSRPSEDLWKDNVHAKRSFDTINSQMSSKGTLYALAQESLSATSLGKSVPRDGILSKFSGLGRARTPTISSTNSTAPPSPPAPTVQQPRKQRYQPPPLLMTSRTTTHETYDTTKHSTDYSAGESIHPYANPDVMPPPSLAAPPVSPMSVQFPRGPPEPWETQRDPSYPKSISSSVAAPPLSPKNMQFPRSQMEPMFNPQRTSIQRGKRASSIQGKGISSPIAVQGSALPSSMSNESTHLGNALSGWTDRVVPPAFSLISLEEARAQKGKTANADDLSRTLSSSTTISTTDSSGAGAPIASSATSIRSSRGRTLSAGAKAKNAIQSMVANGKLDRRDSEPAVPVIGKTLKHKKSGFMRLFNKDKEEAPPVPPLTLVTSLDNESWKRSAVPRLSGRDDQAQSPNRGHKHSPPSLQLAGGADTLSPIDKTLLTKPWANPPQPASAPADVTSFPPLRLRPVSTIFSAQFESFAPELSSNASERHHRSIDTLTSSSPPEQMSPITPGPNSDFFPSSKGDDSQSAAIIKALREELASTKVASEHRIRDLESQIRDLKIEVEELRSFDRRSRTSSMSAHCDNCSNESEGTVGGGYLSVTPRRGGGGCSPNSSLLSVGTSVLHRPRAKTGNGSSRFVNADS